MQFLFAQKFSGAIRHNDVSMTHNDHLNIPSRELSEANEVRRRVTLRISLEKKRKAHEMALYFHISLSQLVEKLLDECAEADLENLL
jgi:predicted HicB family RNase H-like nuclease